MGPLLLILIPGTIWVTGNLLLGAVVARTVFSHAPAPMAAVGPDQISRAMAGQLFGDALQMWYGVPLSIACVAVCIGLGWLGGRAKAAGKPLTTAALIMAFVALTLLHTQTVAVVKAVGSQAQELRTLTGPELEERRLAFQQAHHASENLVKLETLVVLVLVVGATIAAGRRRTVAALGSSAPATPA